MEKHNWKKAFLFVVLSAAIAGVPRRAAAEITFRYNGMLTVDLMHIVHSTNVQQQVRWYSQDSAWLNGAWLQAVWGNLAFNAALDKKVDAFLQFAGALQFTIPAEDADTLRTTQRIIYARIRLAGFTYRFGTPDWMPSQLTTGIFTFDYKTCGEAFGGYLLRSGAYPNFIYPAYYEPPLRGFNFRLQFPHMLRHDIFVTSQRDWSAAYLLRAGGESQFLNIAAGVIGHRIFTVRNPDFKSERSVWNDGYVDGNDTIWYTHRGVNLMARAEVDLKKIFPRPKWGAEDLKLYAEAALLGVKNYPGYYEDVSRRVPLSGGVNLPVFGILDVLSVEAEYFGSRFYNYFDPSNDFPRPTFDFRHNRDYDPSDGHGPKGKSDDVKWAVSARKTLVKHVSIWAMAASDRWRNGIYEQDPYERFHAPDEWYWKAALTFKF